jgi:hypothetical protein
MRPSASLELKFQFDRRRQSCSNAWESGNKLAILGPLLIIRVDLIGVEIGDANIAAGLTRFSCPIVIVSMANEQINFHDVAPALEFMCWVVVILIPFLRW